MATIPIIAARAHALPAPTFDALDALRTTARFLFALWVLVASFVLAVVIGIPTMMPLLLVPRGKRERVAALPMNLWSWLFTRVLLLARVRVEGRQHLPRERGFLVVSNHRSWADPPFLMWNVTAQGLSFHRVRQFPFMGLCADIAGSVFVNLESAESRKRASDEVIARLQAKSVNLQLYPEGQCTRTGRLAEKAHLRLIERAWESGITVVPAALWGTEDAMPIDCWQARPFAKTSLRIAEPLDREGFFDAKSYAEAVWEQVTRMAAALEREHQR